MFNIYLNIFAGHFVREQYVVSIAVIKIEPPHTSSCYPGL